MVGIEGLITVNSEVIGMHEDFSHSKQSLKRISATLGTNSQFLPAAMREARGRLVLRLLCGFHICIYIYMYVRLHSYNYNNYVTYIVAMQPSVDFGN